MCHYFCYTLYLCLCTQWLISPVGWAGMFYDCANDYTVCGPAGHYNKWLESESEKYKRSQSQKCNSCCNSPVLKATCTEESQYFGPSSGLLTQVWLHIVFLLSPSPPSCNQAPQVWHVYEAWKIQGVVLQDSWSSFLFNVLPSMN